jgi:hypothetical protein
MSDGDFYLVWSHEHGAWWRFGGSGYTHRISEAGRHTRNEALRICTMAMPGATEALNELPVKLEDVQHMMERYRGVYGERNEDWM